MQRRWLRSDPLKASKNCQHSGWMQYEGHVYKSEKRVTSIQISFLKNMTDSKNLKDHKSKKIDATLPPPPQKIFLLKSSLPFSCDLWIYSCYKPPKKHPPNWNSMKTSCCTFSIHGLGLCTYLALRAGDVFSPQLRHCWGQHAQGDRQDDQTWLHLKSWDVFGGDGIRSQNLLLKGRAIGKFPEAKTESRKRRSNFQRLQYLEGVSSQRGL